MEEPAGNLLRWREASTRSQVRRSRSRCACGDIGLNLHYYGMPAWEPEQSHSTCVIARSDTGPLYELFAAGLRDRYGMLPVNGFPEDHAALAEVDQLDSR